MENCKFTTSRSVKRYKFLFVLAIFLSSFLSVYAEDVSNYVEEKTFTFSFENVPLKQVLSHIEKNSEFIFVYYGETINPKTGKKIRGKVYKKEKEPAYPELADLKMSDGFKTNAVFFKLSFLDKTSVALDEERRHW